MVMIHPCPLSLDRVLSLISLLSRSRYVSSPIFRDSRSRDTRHPIVILPADRVFPLRFNMELIARLQSNVAPDVFTPRAVYDGRKNMFAPRALPLGDTGSKEVRIAARHVSSSVT